MFKKILMLSSILVVTAACSVTTEYAGRYEAVHVGDDHKKGENYPKGPHVIKGGHFVIATYVQDDGTTLSAVIADDGNFSKYDWSSLRLAYQAGTKVKSMKMLHDEHGNLVELTVNGTALDAKDLKGMRKQLEALGLEHLHGEVDLHGDGKKHAISTYVFMEGGRKRLLMTYGSARDGRHAGHVHN